MARVVTRWKKTVRRRLAIGGAALTIGASILFVVGVLPASAHSALLSGRTVCGNGTHVIRWSIGNDYGLPMTITSASATKGTTSYAVTGYHATVGPVGGASDTTSATTVVPGSVTGNVTLRVHARWSDGFTASASTSVSLIGPCGSTGSTTTTTLVTQGSTLPPPTTTSTVQSTTTTLVTQGSTLPPPTTTSTLASTGSTVAGPTTGPPTSNSASNGGTPVGPLGGPTRPSGGSSIARQLPFTGSSYVGPMLGVGSLVLGGVAVAAGSARKRRRQTM